jgi:hypothetical protein
MPSLHDLTSFWKPKYVLLSFLRVWCWFIWLISCRLQMCRNVRTSVGRGATKGRAPSRDWVIGLTAANGTQYIIVDPHLMNLKGASKVYPSNSNSVVYVVKYAKICCQSLFRGLWVQEYVPYKFMFTNPKHWPEFAKVSLRLKLQLSHLHSTQGFCLQICKTRTIANMENFKIIFTCWMGCT